MSALNRHSFRIVVQHMPLGEHCVFRLMAYGDGQTFPPRDFDSLQHVMGALHWLIPDFDENDLIVRDAHDTYIAFTGEAELNDSQLSKLGLKDGPKS
jgi:hypothetical protein